MPEIGRTKKYNNTRNEKSQGYSTGNCFNYKAVYKYNALLGLETVIKTEGRIICSGKELACTLLNWLYWSGFIDWRWQIVMNGSDVHTDNSTGQK